MKKADNVAKSLEKIASWADSAPRQFPATRAKLGVHLNTLVMALGHDQLAQELFDDAKNHSKKAQAGEHGFIIESSTACLV